ncbi:3799_t:CDS:1, partial [Dentiscutata erythropus]
TKWVDPKTEEEKTIVVSEDDGIRKSTTVEGLAKLKPAFAKDGTTTAGSSSQVSDGAAAVLLMKRKKAEKLGLPILGKFIRASVVGVPPNVMGIGPAYAIPSVLKQVGLGINDIDIYEINEAFASQAVYCVEKLGIDINKVNPKGGAIAIGHPLGCTGARQISTLLYELRRTNKKLGVISMCVGSGMGMAAVFEAE